MDWDLDPDCYPCYEKIGEFIEDPRYVIFLDKDPDKKYGSNQFDLKSYANDVVHYLSMRNSCCDIKEAISDCILKQPDVVIIDVHNNKEYKGKYVVLH